jgi:DNA-binding CsgD family transcriptional regulator
MSILVNSYSIGAMPVSRMLYGRDLEQKTIAQILTSTVSGRPRGLVLRGAAGIGKSALLDYAATLSPGRVLRLAGVESEAELPYAALHLLLHPVLDRVPRLVPRQAAALHGALGLGAATPGDRFLVGLATMNVLAELSAPPLLCLIDDAQWLDQESVHALLFAVRRLQGAPVTVLFAARDEDRRFPAGGLPELRLDGLGLEAARQLADSAAALAPPVRDRIVAEACGNPLALLELPRTLTAAQRAGDLSPVSGFGTAEPPLSRVVASFRARIRALPPTARSALLIAALDDGGGLETVTRALSMSGAALADFAPTERAALVRVTGTGIEFRHPLVRTAARLASDVAERADAHRALAAATDNDRRAWHCAAVAMGPDEEIAALLEDAAIRARRRGGLIAVSAAYARAAELSPDPLARARRATSAAAAAHEAGLSERATELAWRVRPVPGADSTVVAALARVRAALEFEAGRPLAAARLLHDGAAALGGRAAKDRVTSLTMLGWAAIYLWASPPHPEQAELARRTEELVVPLPGPLGAVHAFARDVRLLMDGARPVIDSAPHGLGQIDILPFELRLLAAFLSFARGDVHEMLSAATGLVDNCSATGRIGRLPQAMMVLAMAQSANGDFQAARATVAEGRRLASDMEQPYWKYYLAGLAAWLAALAGDETQCRAYAAEANERSDVWMTGPAWATLALVVLDSGLGRYRQVLQRFDASAAGPVRYAFAWRYLYPDYIEAATRAGEPALADAMLARFAEWAQAIEQPWAQAVLYRCRALRADGDPTELFETALQLHAQDRQPFERARTELGYGQWLRRHNRRTAARTRLRSALRTFDELGAIPWRDRAASELQATGALLDEGPGPDPLAVLTPQEHRVVQLAATGATNREIGARLFLSARTVAYHLYKAFPKLGVTSRAELRGFE